jgi:release factor glutamine methyltransferase
VSGETWTLMELLRWTTDFFKKHELPTARLDAELLLAHVLSVSRMDLYLAFDRPIDEGERARYRELVRRRAKERVPVAYLTGVREFWSLPFKVTPDVLIPRPETETLVRVAVEQRPGRVLELGVGSGCVTAALLRELPEAHVTALDVSPAALALARENLEKLGLAERARLLEADGFESLETRFDLVVSNPPYVPTGELAGLQPELRHEPRLALDGGPDGLDVIRRVAATVGERLERPGAVAVEVGAGQADRTVELLRAGGATEAEVFKDLAGVPRVVLGRFPI